MLIDVSRRFRRYRRHEILGSRLLEGSDLEPTWRNVLRLSDVPWIHDHKLMDDVVFPAAGYIAMAGEAIRQLSGSEDFSLRHLDIKSALVLNDAHNAELVTSFRPVRLTATLDSAWYEFSISSHNGNMWTKHCVGQARGGKDVQTQSHIEQPRQVTALPRHVTSPYASMKKVGLNYGPTFQGLRDVTTMPGKTTAVATLREAYSSDYTYSLHPTTIDHMLQLFIFAAADGINRNIKKLVVPTHIEHLYVNCQNGQADMRAEAAAVPGRTTGAITGSAVIVADHEVLLSLQGGRFSPLEDGSVSEETDSIAAARLHWRPDMDFVRLESLMDAHSKDPKAIEEVERYGVLCSIEMQHMIEGIDCPEYLEKFRKWISSHVEEAAKGENKIVENGRSLTLFNQAERLALIEKAREQLKTSEFAAAAELISRLFDNCVGIYRGQTEALEVYLRDNGLTNVYNLTADRVRSTEFFVSAGHTNPTMRILEIGAGTGGTALVALKALTSINGERMYSKYTYTDISSGFFGMAKDRFAEFPGLEYKTLDISKDPAEQGLECGTYDLIIASNVIHATAILGTTLKHVRKLLHPRGRFFLQELSPSSAKIINLIMGVLPGWWLGEADGRPMEPIVTVDRWDKELTSAGFAGIEALVYDDPRKESHIGVNIIARPAQPVQDFRSVTLLHQDAHKESLHVQEVEDVLVKQGFNVDRCIFGEPIPPAQDVISLLDLETPIIDKISPKDFASLKEVLSDIGSSHILWVTRSAQLGCEDPRYSQSLGLARTIRSELSISLATLEVDEFDSSACDAIVKVFDKIQDTSVQVNPESEFVLKDREILVGRYHWTTVSKELSTDQGSEKRPLKLEVGRPGLVHSLRWVPYALNELGPDEVVVDPRTVGMNFRDVLVTMGLVEEGGVGLGLEGSGVISAVGSNVQRLKPGDRVFMMGQNCFSTHNITPANRVVKIPDTLTFEEAATMPCVYSTVIHALMKMAHLQKDQSILIHSACGGVGLSAIQICQMIGAKVRYIHPSDSKPTNSSRFIARSVRRRRCSIL